MRKLLMATTMLAASALSAQAADLRVALSTFISNMDPQDQTGNNGAPMLYQVYDTLVERDSFSNPLTFKPGLATEWTQIEPTVWELKLREGVKMHDGTTMDADDVAFSLNRMILDKDPEFAPAWGRWFYNFDKVEVVDPLTVRIHTFREDPLFLTMISARSAGITSKEHYEKMGFEDASLHPVGTGPYKVVEFRPREQAVMERFDGFWGEAAPFDKIDFQYVKEVASRVTGLVNGEFDLVTNIPPDQESAMEQDGLAVKGVTWPMFHVWIIAQNNTPTDDPRVRKALRLCTDRQALVDGLWGGKADVPHAHQFEEYGAPYYMPDLDLIKYDPEQAKALLAEAGYDGTPILAQFPRSYYLYGDLAAQVIQQQWAQCGVTLELQEVDEIDYKKVNVRAWSNPMDYPDGRDQGPPQGGLARAPAAAGGDGGGSGDRRGAADAAHARGGGAHGTGIDEKRPDIDENTVVATLAPFDDMWAALIPAEQARVVQLLVARVTVGEDGMDIDLRHDGLGALASLLTPKTEDAA